MAYDYPVMRPSSMKVSDFRLLRYALWGACGDDPWRDSVLHQMVEQMGIDPTTILDPNDPDWNPESADYEDTAKKFTWLDFFYIGGLTRGTVSLVEMVAHTLIGKNVIPVVDLINEGLVIEGQPLDEKEIVVLNNMRLMAIDLVKAAGVKVYKTLDEATNAIPVSRKDLRDHRIRHLSAAHKAAVKRVLVKWGFGDWVTSHSARVSENPYQSQLELLAIMATCLIREGGNDSFSVVIPSAEHMVANLDGRRQKDFGRTSDPYFFDLIENSSINLDVYVI